VNRLHSVPDDLMTAREAATYIERSLSSVRSWVRQGKVEGYREVPGDVMSRLLVSRAEIELLRSPEKVTTTVVPSLRDDLETVKDLLRQLVGEVERLREEVSSLRHTEPETVEIIQPIERKTKEYGEMSVAELLEEKWVASRAERSRINSILWWEKGYRWDGNMSLAEQQHALTDEVPDIDPGGVLIRDIPTLRGLGLPPEMPLWMLQDMDVEEILEGYKKGRQILLALDELDV
jgi:hypothetical protein